MLTTTNNYHFGPQLLGNGKAIYNLWAPDAGQVELVCPTGVLRMDADKNGWYALEAPGEHGTLYKFRINGRLEVPDPASRYQQSGPHGPSMIWDPSRYEWKAKAWSGRPWHEMILYEMHFGTFTPEGTYRAAIDRLDHLVDLGITGLQVMPVSQFSGGRGWGYDGVLPYAPHNTYGTPDDLRAFVDACRERELAVFLDVVYNHFGPEGNYLGCYCKPFFGQEPSPWGGEVINYDGEHSQLVRLFTVRNALYWIEDFLMSGLRLDAVHAIRDRSPRHIVCEIDEALQAGPGQSQKVYIILENDGNEACLLSPTAAQWGDDLRHAAATAVGLDTTGLSPWYVDYTHPLESPGHGPVGNLAIALAGGGFVYQGERSHHRGGRPRGESARHLRQTGVLFAFNNHDWTGNGPFGKRPASHMSAEQLRLLATLVALSPKTPVTFQGDEWLTQRPFIFFVDHLDHSVRQATREGRIAEFRANPQFAAAAEQGLIPHPDDLPTFLISKNNWAELAQPEHARWLEFQRGLFRLRRRHLWPLLKGDKATGDDGRVVMLESNVLVVEWKFQTGVWVMAANFGRTEEADDGLRQLKGDLVFELMENAHRDMLTTGKLPPQCAVFTSRLP